MTDFTAVSLDDILSSFCGWLTHTSKTIDLLESYEISVENNRSLIESPNEVLTFIRIFGDLFSRYKNDLEILIAEMPNRVVEGHIEIVRQLNDSARYEEELTIQFKNDWVHKSLPHEEVRPLLDNIYANTRDLLVDYKDMSNILPRLKTFLRPHSISSEALSPWLEIKPNLFGIGLNLNRLIPNIKKWWKGKQHKGN